MSQPKPVPEDLGQFCTMLRELRQRCGQPSLAILSRLMPSAPGTSTLSDLLGGNIRRPPRWDLVFRLPPVANTYARRDGRRLPSTLAMFRSGAAGTRTWSVSLKRSNGQRGQAGCNGPAVPDPSSSNRCVEPRRSRHPQGDRHSRSRASFRVLSDAVHHEASRSGTLRATHRLGAADGRIRSW